MNELARPAGLEPATSWFVVVTRKIEGHRLMTTKITPRSDLRAKRLITVDRHRHQQTAILDVGCVTIRVTAQQHARRLVSARQALRGTALAQ
jgi:hypothetical protein